MYMGLLGHLGLMRYGASCQMNGRNLIVDNCCSKAGGLSKQSKTGLL